MQVRTGFFPGQRHCLADKNRSGVHTGIEFHNTYSSRGVPVENGSLDWGWTGDKALSLALDGTTIDVSGLQPGLLDFDTWRAGQLPPGPEAQPGQPRAAPPAPVSTAVASPLAALGAKARLVNAAVGKLHLKIRAQNVIDGANALRDVDADLSFEPSGLLIPGLKFISRDGVAVDVQGELKSLESKPAGRIKGWLSARSAPSVQALIKMLTAGNGAAQQSFPARVSSVDLGFAAVLGGDRTDQVSLRANGSIDDGRIDLALMLGGGLVSSRAVGQLRGGGGKAGLARRYP